MDIVSNQVEYEVMMQTYLGGGGLGGRLLLLVGVRRVVRVGIGLDGGLSSRLLLLRRVGVGVGVRRLLLLGGSLLCGTVGLCGGLGLLLGLRVGRVGAAAGHLLVRVRRLRLRLGCRLLLGLLALLGILLGDLGGLLCDLLGLGLGGVGGLGDATLLDGDGLSGRGCLLGGLVLGHCDVFYLF